MRAPSTSSVESGARAGWDGHKRRKGSKVHLAVDTLGHLLALHVTAANEQERAQQVEELAAQVQEATGENVRLAYADEGYTGEDPAKAAAEQGMELVVTQAFRAQARPCAAAQTLAWWSAPRHGQPAFVAWPGTANGCPPRSQGSTSSPSPASCSQGSLQLTLRES